MHDVLRFWLDRGVDGFRADVIHRIGKDPALRDNRGIAGCHRRHPPRRGLAVGPSADSGGCIAWCDSYGARMLVGEVYLLDQRRLAAYVRTGRELDLAHNFHFLNLPWDDVAFRDAIVAFEGLTDVAGRPGASTTTIIHGSLRVTAAGGARAAAVLLLTLRGTPFLYQGEELGLRMPSCPPSRVLDVDGRDPSRTPMPWVPATQARSTAGFSDGVPWLPVHPDSERLAVAAQADDPASKLQLYRALIALRRAEPALREGSYRSLEAALRLLVRPRARRPTAPAGPQLRAVSSTAAGRGSRRATAPVDAERI